MKIFKTLLPMCAVALAMTSCLDSGKNETSTTITVDDSQNFNYVYNVETNQGELLDGADYIIKYIWSDSKADVVVRDLELENGAGKIGFTMSGLKITQAQDGATVISVPSVIDDDNNHVITSLTIKRWERFVGNYGLYDPITIISYVLDNKYVVRMVQSKFTLVGVTRDTSLANAQELAQFPMYTFAFQQNGKATITAQNITLAEQNFSKVVMNNVPFSVDTQGINFNLSGTVEATFTPEPSLTPITITSFAGIIDLNYTATLSYIINDESRMSAHIGVLNPEMNNNN